MHVVWGAVVALLSLIAWGGQTVSWLAPRRAHPLADTGTRSEPAYWIGIRGEAPLDAVTLWTMMVAGVLLILGIGAWAYFGLVGGGMYVYFAGRGLLDHVVAERGGVPANQRRDHTIGYLMLVTWAVMGLAMIVAAMVALSTT